MSEVSSILIAAKAVLEGGWCQHACARDEAGIPVGTTDLAARTFCVMGALLTLRLPHKEESLAIVRLHATARKLDSAYTSAALYNDTPERTHADVLNLYDVAIADAVAEEAEQVA